MKMVLPIMNKFAPISQSICQSIRERPLVGVLSILFLVFDFILMIGELLSKELDLAKVL